MTTRSVGLPPLASDFLAKKLILIVCASFAVAFATDRPLYAQVQQPPVTGTAGFETGVRVLAGNIMLDHVAHLGDANPLGAKVNWGDGTPGAPGLLTCDGALNSDVCDIWGTHTYALPGNYTITIQYDEPAFIGNGPRHSVTSTANISLAGDFVILSIGDSVASGEGNPSVNYTRVIGMDPDHAFWDDPGSDYNIVGGNNEQEETRRDCHRSGKAGPSLAESKVAQTNPITFDHFACSGATVFTRNASKNSSTALGQLRIARSHLPRIDILLISAGANDMHFTKPNGDPGEGFGDVLTRCLKPGNNCSDDPNFRHDINNSITGIHDDYVKLDQVIHCINPDDGTREPDCSDQQIPKLILITEYMDETHNERVFSPSTDGFPSGGCLDAGVRESEWKFLYNNVVVPLNEQVRQSPWHAVTRIQDDFMEHGYCSGTQRWIVTVPDSVIALGGANLDAGRGSGHPNRDGHNDYMDRIYAAMVALNPPATTADATPYSFGTWAYQDVVMTLSPSNGIKESGVRGTFYAVDNPNCQYNPNFADNRPNCSIYSGPFTIATSGRHTVTFFSENVGRSPEAIQSVQVLVDKNPPLSSAPDTMTIHAGQSASYTITVGHQGWAGQTINLHCSTDGELAGCTMLPTSVTLDATGSNTSVATVITTLGGGLMPPPGAQPNPFNPLGLLRLLLMIATVVFLAAMTRALRVRRWMPVTQFAALALLFGLLSAGCNSAAKIPGTTQGTYTVIITGTSDTTTNTVQTKLVVQ